MELEVCKGADAGPCPRGPGRGVAGRADHAFCLPCSLLGTTRSCTGWTTLPSRTTLPTVPATAARCPLPAYGCPWNTGSCSHRGMKHARSSTVGCTHHRRAGRSRG